MINMHTKFEVSSLSRSRDILGVTKNLKWVTWRDHAPFRDGFVICRLGLAMFNRHIKFKMSTITCNEEMKCNAKCKIFSFWATLWGLRGNAQGLSIARWKARCRLPISDNWTFIVSCHGCGTIKRNPSKSAFSEGGGSLWAQIFGRWGRRPQSFYEPLDRGTM